MVTTEGKLEPVKIQEVDGMLATSRSAGDSRNSRKADGSNNIGNCRRAKGQEAGT
jgi:hypothetical protein